jgi:hypothetical protein
VCESRVNLLVYSLSLHRHSYIGFILDFASPIHNKQQNNNISLLEVDTLMCRSICRLSKLVSMQFFPNYRITMTAHIALYGHVLGFRYMTCWSVTQLMRLNSRITGSPDFALVGILITNPSGLLFHILSIMIFSLWLSVLCFLSSVSVKGQCLSCPMVVFSRVCTDYKLKTSGNSSSRSFHIVFRFFSPLIQTNHHSEDVKRPNSA